MSMTFEDLDAWKKSRELVNAVYKITREPALARDFGLSNQVQRAAVSVMSNLAEGFERQGTGEKLQAYNIARGSAGEVRSLLYVIEDNYPACGREAVNARALVGDVGRLATGLITSTRRRLAAKVGAQSALVVAVVWCCLRFI